ncbi:ribonuclease H-like domain-containing protein [Auriculariales sp. MPI-PUGE-AT-0066]|nr:ribonuclease H-like domain-containing protein [Auriculariales sp. MPI-PUGE-AT-0066]
MSENTPSSVYGQPSFLRQYFEVTAIPYQNNNTAKSAWCNGCVDQKVNDILEFDRQRVNSGEPGTTVRSLEEAKVAAQAQIPPINSSPDKLLAHIPHSSAPSVSAPSGLPTMQPASASPAPAVPPSLDTFAPPHAWEPELQEDFAADLCRLFVALRLAWQAVESPELRTFFRKWLPGTIVPHRDTLSGRILRQQNQVAMNRIKGVIGQSDRLATIQCDGWKMVTRKPIILTMINVNRKEYAIRSHDMFSEDKTGDRLWLAMQSDIQLASDTYNVDIVGICTDDGPDGKKMRRLAQAEMVWLVVTLCWAHQCQLIVGDLFKHAPGMRTTLNEALAVIKWFSNHGKAQYLLHMEQRGTTRPLTLVTPNLTRWSSHGNAIARLVRLKVPLQSTVVNHRVELLGMHARADDESGSTAVTEIICSIESAQFWASAECLEAHLKPLVVAQDILQKPNLRLDEVVATLVSWSHEYFCLFSLPFPFLLP